MNYVKLNVPNLKEIQQEVLDYIDKNSILLRPDAEDEYFVQMDYSKFPKLYDFVFSRSKTDVIETSSCYLPGYKKLMRHIDGLKKDNGKVPEGVTIANQWVLIIPIANTENTVSHWFNNNDVADEDEIIVNRIRPEPPYNFYVSFVKPEKELAPIDTTTVDQMTIIKSNIYHTVINNGPNIRIVFIVRFKEEKKEYPTPEELFEYKDLV